jgi:hypothetical protein
VLAHFLEGPFGRPFASTASTYSRPVVVDVDATGLQWRCAALRKDGGCGHGFHEFSS